MAILNIETATAVCSVSLTENEQVLAERVAFNGPSHASLLAVFVDDVVKKSKILGRTIKAIAVSSGPGSYTGLRIGVSMAKGLCFGWNIPLLNIPTLDILARKVVLSVPNDTSSNALFCAMLDARRMEVYVALYDCSLQKIRDTEAVVVTENSFSSFLEQQKVYFFGNGANKCKNLLPSPNATFIDGIHPLAGDMAVLSEQAYREKRFEDVAYFEPFYLKDFVATVPRGVAGMFR